MHLCKWGVVSKREAAYIKALGVLYALKNQNDQPFTIHEIQQQPTLQEFSFTGKNDFIYICQLKAEPMTIIGNRRTNEKIKAINFTSDEAQRIFNQSSGVAYLITCPLEDKEHIIKIGQTRKTFKERLGSYNCGTVYNWRTASTTNIKITQSMVATRLPFKLYLCDCSDDPYTIVWHGVESAPFPSPKSLAIEDIMVKKFIEQFNHKPLANIQVDANN
ncbi:hypothetical protein NHP190003_08720 [Helicobacter sp. NHP19-003]|uniref:GIY-YIG nuclease family protein n=1 Tax=Helicobacter gastrocanis TaxID=2849641 RepID=A0ABM7SAF5_9HELI|nr:hypothetical protein [Helicobacter sp. NHP19-003]BCZ17590.1 hypothetical protein NHP190003_08720 [Helicobacter sp. NHP19-003]